MFHRFYYASIITRITQTENKTKSSMQFSKIYLVDLDFAVDLPNEKESRVEPDRAGDEPERDRHYNAVGEVQQCGDKLVDIQLGTEVENTVTKDVDC
jgi:hypothetical protein